MAAYLEASYDYRSLTKKLRNYSVRNVKIGEDDMSRTRRLVSDIIGDKIMFYCQENSSLPILRLEYTGSAYERLKTEFADEVDVMVVLRTSKQEVTNYTNKPSLATGAGVAVTSPSDFPCKIPGYAQLKASEKSPLKKFTNSDGLIVPERLLNGWFFSLVDRAVKHWSPKVSHKVVVRAHGPAVQLDIYQRNTLSESLWRPTERILSVDLVPCFLVGENYYVAKPYLGSSVPNADLLWRHSFSLDEKQILQCMDRDNGCRHELLRIIKVIVKREDTSLGKLTSYHLKTAFLHYNDKHHNWSRDTLGRHFVGYMEKLEGYLESGYLPHYWLPKVNLLEGIDEKVTKPMASRLKRILNSEKEKNKILEN